MEYHQIYNSEIFVKSQCIHKENAFVEFMRMLLSSLGYTAHDARRFIWRRDNRRVYLALVDDLISVTDYTEDIFNNLQKDDVVITDNFFNRPVNAQVFALPISWFGIYAHSPTVTISEPNHEFGLAINRIDYNRIMIFLEMHRCGYVDQHSLVNFNCATHSNTEDRTQVQTLWQHNFENLDEYYQSLYLSYYKRLTTQMPFRNHDFTVDMQHLLAKTNIVVETYAGDDGIAMSEKIFRALTLPRLWRVFSGPWTVKYLESIGFDCMSDIINHDTDGLKMIENKIAKFVHSCAQTWQTNKWQDCHHRATEAAQHNVDRLHKLKASWPRDFAQWLPTVIKGLE